MVATVRCKQIANEKYADFSGNEEWSQLEEVVQFGPVSGFGKKLSSIFDTCLSEYDAQATYFDEGVRKRKQLEEKLLQLVQPAFQALLGHIRSGSLDKFKEAFDKALNGEEAFSVAARNCSESFMALFDEGCAGVHRKNWRMPYQDRLEALLDGVNGETWPSIRNLFRCETESAVSGISSAFSGICKRSSGSENKGRGWKVRLDDYAADNIENTLSLALMDSTNAAAEDRSITTADPLASSTWQEVPFLLFPPQNIDQICRVQILVEAIQAMV
ncbi:unnamed protein product [Prunus armeniaca]